MKQKLILDIDSPESTNRMSQSPKRIPPTEVALPIKQRPSRKYKFYRLDKEKDIFKFFKNERLNFKRMARKHAVKQDPRIISELLSSKSRSVLKDERKL